MRAARAVAWKEIQVYFSSPTAYIVGMMFLALTGVLFARGLGGPLPEASLSDFFQGATIILLLLGPALTMRLMAEEQKLGTIELLLTSPVGDWEIVVGKYLASLAILVGTVAFTLYYTIMLVVFANPDPGPVYAGYLGLFLYGAAALSVGLLASTLTSNQIVAAVVAMGILLALYSIDFATGAVDGTASTILSGLSIRSHFDDFNRGIIDTKHVVYYLSFTAFFLFLTIRALESRRWR
jgi:ABC-2 type transport system permease protein